MQVQLTKQKVRESEALLRSRLNALSIRRILDVISPLEVTGPRAGFVTDVTCDSRKVTPCGCFVAIKGEKLDGHHYTPQALAAGATLFVVERAIQFAHKATVAVVENARKAAALIACEFYRHPSRELDLVGITGTHGKTTAAYMIRHIAEFAGRTAGMLTTVKYEYADSTFPALQTTPGPIRLNQMLREAVQSGVQIMPMEVSSHSLCQHRVRGLNFRAGVFTNLGRDHLDYHLTHEAYRKAKARLFEMLDSKAFCVLNADDPNWIYYAGQTCARVVTYSARRAANVKGHITSASVDGVKFDLVTRGGAHRVNLCIPGTHNVENALTAAACGLSLGIDCRTVAEALSTFPGVPGRFERVEIRAEERGLRVFVDYAHTAGALETVLSDVKPFVQGRLIVVFGAGGDRDKGKRPRMAKASQEHADFSIVTSDNPRTEDPMQIIRQIQAGFAGERSYTIRPDRREAIKTALAMARKGDVVVVAGKGHEDYQIFADRVEHFDDREVVRETLSNYP